MLCARCLRAAAEPRAWRGVAWRPIARVLAATAGFLLVWFTLQFYGQHLAALPDDFHQRVLWREDPLDR
jgi:hypothetical protein